MSSQGGFYQRDYNIINFHPALLNKKAHVVSEPVLPQISMASTKPFQKNFSTINMGNSSTARNNYPFENVVNQMREKKKYDPLMESKISSNTKFDKNTKATVFNSSGLEYDFITFAKKKNPETMATIKGENPRSCYKKSAVSEFAHIGRVTSPNFNQNFQGIYGKDQTAFRLRTGMGGQYLDSKKSYGDIGSCFKRSGK